MSGLSNLRHRPYLLLSSSVVALVAAATSPQFGWAKGVCLGWSLGVLTFSALLLRDMRTATVETMKQRALILDEGRYAILGICIAAAATAFVAITGVLSHARDGGHEGWSILLGASAMILAWAFVHLIFTLHYAHQYYRDGGGLGFPGAEQPSYWDFAYFSFVVGMTAQVSDVTVQNSDLRRIVLFHGILAFLFNTAVLALGINIAASLLN